MVVGGVGSGWQENSVFIDGWKGSDGEGKADDATRGGGRACGMGRLAGVLSLSGAEPGLRVAHGAWVVESPRTRQGEWVQMLAGVAVPLRIWKHF